jgi:hypothetical protein
MKMLTFLGCLLFPIIVIAQHGSSRNLAVRFGGVEPGPITGQQILMQPKLLEKNGMGKITDFTVTFFPKGQDMIGPFHTKGDSLTVAEITIIKRLQGISTRVIFEDIHIHVNIDDYTRTVVPLVYMYSN